MRFSPGLRSMAASGVVATVFVVASVDPSWRVLAAAQDPVDTAKKDEPSAQGPAVPKESAPAKESAVGKTEPETKSEPAAKTEAAAKTEPEPVPAKTKPAATESPAEATAPASPQPQRKKGSVAKKGTPKKKTAPAKKKPAPAAEPFESVPAPARPSFRPIERPIGRPFPTFPTEIAPSPPVEAVPAQIPVPADEIAVRPAPDAERDPLDQSDEELETYIAQRQASSATLGIAASQSAQELEKLKAERSQALSKFVAARAELDPAIRAAELKRVVEGAKIADDGQDDRTKLIGEYEKKIRDIDVRERESLIKWRDNRHEFHRISGELEYAEMVKRKRESRKKLVADTNP